MRIAFLLSFAANVALDLMSLAILPARVAIHFGSGGLPNGWASNAFNTLALLGLHGFLFCAFVFTPRLIFAVPARWVNLPNKSYWLAPENRRRTAALLDSQMAQFGTALLLFLFAVGLLALRANRSISVRLNERAFLLFLSLFLVFTIAWCVAFYRRFRLPPAG